MLFNTSPDPSGGWRWVRPKAKDGNEDAGATQKYVSFKPFVTFEFNRADGNPTVLVHDPEVPLEVEERIDEVVGSARFDPELHKTGYRLVLRFEKAINL